jgi:hypothetical protein
MKLIKKPYNKRPYLLLIEDKKDVYSFWLDTADIVDLRTQIDEEMEKKC